MQVKMECFGGTLERIYLESNNICFGPRPESDEEVERQLELSATDVGRMRRYSMGDEGADERPMREMALLVGKERARKILMWLENISPIMSSIALRRIIASAPLPLWASKSMAFFSVFFPLTNAVVIDLCFIDCEETG